MRVSILSLLITILFMGCAEEEIRETSDQAVESIGKQNEPAVNSESPQKIKFEQEITYDSTDDVVFGEIATVAVDNRSRVFIADSDQTTIHVLNSDGNYITSLGRQGKGPGEFNAVNPYTTVAIHMNRLYVTDVFFYSPHRAQVFLIEDLSFSHTLPLLAENSENYELEGYYPRRIYPRNDGNFLVSYRRRPTEYKYRDKEKFVKYFIQDSTGHIISDGPILEQKGLTYLKYQYPNQTRKIHSFPFLERSLFTVSKDDHLYAAWSAGFKIVVYNPDGERVKTVQYPFKNKIFNKRKVLDQYEKMDYMSVLDDYEGEDIALKMIREAKTLPDTWPALGTIFFDDEERLWISTIVDNEEVYEWWMLEKNGELITKFEWPRNKPIEVVKNGKMYTRETDEETGLQQVVRYRVEMEDY